MFCISARDCFRLGFRERLKRMDNERAWMMESEDLERLRKTGMAPSVSASKFLFLGLTLVMETRVLRAFCWTSWESN